MANSVDEKGSSAAHTGVLAGVEVRVLGTSDAEAVDDEEVGGTD